MSHPPLAIKKSRRPSLRQCDLDAAAALTARGLKPSAIEILPSGVRFRFGEIAASSLDDLDAELAAFEAKHNEG